MIDTYNLFVTKISHGRLPLQPLLHDKILSYVNKNYKEVDLASCRKGFQFHENFDGKKELEQHLNNHLNIFFKNKISHGWLNVLGDNSYNLPHSHNGNGIILSGVFYLSNGNNINFTKDSDVFEIKPKIFDYLIFPYDLVHYVLSEKRDEKRICYAFNLKQINE